MTEPYKAPKGTIVKSDPVRKRLIMAEPNGDVVILGFDFTNMDEHGAVPAVERKRFTAHEIAVQRGLEQRAITLAVEETRKLKVLQS